MRDLTMGIARRRVVALVAVALLASRGEVARAQDEGDGAPWLGIQLDPGPHGGVAVRGVLPGSPAERAHLALGDEVLSLDGHKVAQPRELVERVAASRAGARVRLDVLSAGKRRSVEVTLEPRPAPDEIQRAALDGRPAPDLPLRVVAGAAAPRLSALKGSVVLLDFYATWCGPCRESMPRLERLHERFGKKGLRVLGVSTEDAATVAGSARRFHLGYTLVSDEDRALSDRFQVFALPTVVLLDRRGVVHRVVVGDADAAEAAVLALLDGR